MTAYSVQNEKDIHQEIQLETIALAVKGKENEQASKPKLKKFVCQTNCIVQPLRGYFERHGRYVAKHPYPFFIIPLIVTGCLSYGLWHLEIIEDVERLFAPRNGVSKLERKIAADNFYTEKKDHFIPGASLITWMQGPVFQSDAVACRLANGSSSFIWKLHCHWLRSMRQSQVAVAIHTQTSWLPRVLEFGFSVLESNNLFSRTWNSQWFLKILISPEKILELVCWRMTFMDLWPMHVILRVFESFVNC